GLLFRPCRVRAGLARGLRLRCWLRLRWWLRLRRDRQQASRVAGEAVAKRAVQDHRHAAVARDQAVPDAGHRLFAREHVDVLALDRDATVLRDEAAVVLGVALEVARQAQIFGDEERCAERDHIHVHGHAQERGDGLAGGAAAPRVALGLEGFEADLLLAARAAARAAAVALGEAERAAVGEQAAALHAQRV